jgi:hypothetical protein
VVGSLRLRGQRYENIGAADTVLRVSIQLSGTVVFPEHTADTAVVTAPFQFRGTFIGFAQPDERYDLTGQGVVTFSLQWSEVVQTWWVARAEFQFSPRPEPR